MALLWIAAFAAVVVGIAGIVLPAIPGVPLVFLGLVLGAAADGFERVGWPSLLFLAFLTLVGIVADFAGGVLGAKRVGASAAAVALAVVGSVVGLFFGIPGIVLGPFVGAALGEWLARRDLRRSAKVGVATTLGLAVAAAAKVAVVFAMLAVFAFAWWF